MSIPNNVPTESLVPEIRRYFGFVPPFFAAVQANPPLLATLWQQTRTTYIDNPLPMLVKERIFLYLSYVCNVPYDLRHHCIILNSNGIKMDDILTLLRTSPPTEQEIEQHVSHIRTIPQALESWPPAESALEIALYACITCLFIQKQPTSNCRIELQRILGSHYIFLTALLNYIRTCHIWIEADPTTFQEKDQKIMQSFDALFGKETQLHTLLDEHHANVHAELSEHKQTEQQAYEMALQETNQRMNDFLGITAHELKTPITTIKGTIQILLRTIKREMQRSAITLEEYKKTLGAMQQLLSRADNQIRRLTQLINDIVYISRIQDEKLDLRIEQHNLSNVVQDIVLQQSQLNPNRKIKNSNQMETALVMIDRDHIEQVITNYLSNALKYSQEDQPVSVSLQQEGTNVRVSIQGLGPGIAPEDQKHIWERFYRIQHTEVLSSSGVGFCLGLYINRLIIEQHGGEVGVESTPGQGTTFWFLLHLAKPDC